MFFLDLLIDHVVYKIRISILQGQRGHLQIASFVWSKAQSPRESWNILILVQLCKALCNFVLKYYYYYYYYYYIQFTLIQDKEKQQNLTFGEAGRLYIWHFCLKNYLND